nr:MAG TPA: Neuroendocrine protein 7B2 precursor (Secretogranin V) [Caudoviricetes sp.]
MGLSVHYCPPNPCYAEYGGSVFSPRLTAK